MTAAPVGPRLDPRLPRVLFWVAVAALAVAHVALVIPGLTFTRLWEDEAYNLTVPLNLLAGHGYASDALLMPQSAPLLFDARISTGPAVLGPVAAVLATGIDPVVGARLVMAVYYAALLAGLWVLGRHLAGRWGGLVAAAVPLALSTNHGASAMQGPTDLLGEVPAAAFLVWGLVLARRHPLWCGVMLGLAVNTKALATLGAFAVAVAVAALPAATWGRRVLRVFWGGVGALIPLAAWQAFTFVALGGYDGYYAHARDYYYFFRDGGQKGYTVAPGEKLWMLVESWFLPGALVVGLVLAAIVLAVVAWPRGVGSGAGKAAARGADRGGRAVASGVGDATSADGSGGGRTGPFATHVEALVVGAVSVLGVAVWAGWWIASEHTPAWVRYMVTPFFVFVPPLAAIVVRQARRLWGGSFAFVAGRPSLPSVIGGRSLVRAGSRAGCAVAVVASVAVALVLVAQAALHTTELGPTKWGTLQQQRVAAAELAASGVEEMYVTWGPAIGAAVLSGVPFSDENPTAPHLLWAFKGDDPAAALEQKVADECEGDPLVRVEQYALCTPAR